MDWEGKERRKFVRGDLPCKVFIYVPQGHIISSYTEDISQGGARVLLEERLDVGSFIAVEIYSDEEPLIRKGKVVWVKEKQGTNRLGTAWFDTGIEFN